MPCLKSMLSRQAHKQLQLLRASHPAHQASLLCQNVHPLLRFLQLGVAEGDQQTRATSKINPRGKRQRCDHHAEDQAEAAQTAGNRVVAVRLWSSKGSAFVVPDLDSEQFAAETVIKEHEWPQYVHMPKRLRCTNGNHTKKPLHTDIPAC